MVIASQQSNIISVILCGLFSFASAKAMDGEDLPRDRNPRSITQACLPPDILDEQWVDRATESSMTIAMRSLALLGSSFSWCLASCLPESTGADPEIFREATHDHCEAVERACRAPVWHSGDEDVFMLLPCCGIPGVDFLSISRHR